MPRLDVRGGRGPSATVDVMDKGGQLTPASRDRGCTEIPIAACARGWNRPA